MNFYKYKKIVYKKLSKFLKNNFFNKIVGFLVRIKILKSYNKYFNFVLNNYDYNQQNLVAFSGPISATLNVTNLCNYRCKFCEIHFFYKFAKEKSGQVFANNLTIDDLKNYHSWLKNIFNLELSGASGEPFVNPNFIAIVKYLKNKYRNIVLSATTNGSVIKSSDIDALVDYRFDKLLFSVHGGDEDVYKKLQGGDFNKVLNNIKLIADKRKEKKSNYPRLAINFALNKINAESIFNLIDRVKNIGLDYIHVQHYYDVRNNMKIDYEIKDVSYHYDPVEGNQMLNKIYAYAKEKGVGLYPKQPMYLENDIMVAGGIVGKCREPWRSFKIKGCVEDDDTVFIGLCSRIILFKIKYKEFFANGGTFEDIWNHQLVQFFRETINENSICKFCLHPDTRKIRCLDNVQYSLTRDKAVKDFFEEFKKKYPNYKKIKGLEVLSKNPYEFKKDE